MYRVGISRKIEYVKICIWEAQSRVFSLLLLLPTQFKNHNRLLTLEDLAYMVLISYINLN